MSVILALLAILPAADEPLPLQVRFEPPDQCTAIWEGVPLDPAELQKRATAATEAEKTRGVHLQGNTDMPYRCLGSVIYTLQSAGFTRIRFDAEPPSRHVVVRIDRRCRLDLDGQPVAASELSTQAAKLAAEDADVEVRRHREADMACAASVMKILRDAGIEPAERMVSQ